MPNAKEILGLQQQVGDSEEHQDRSGNGHQWGGTVALVLGADIATQLLDEGQRRIRRTAWLNVVDVAEVASSHDLRLTHNWNTIKAGKSLSKFHWRYM